MTTTHRFAPLFLVGLTTLVTAASARADLPADNPVATYYRDQGYPAWTDAVRWADAIDMAKYAKGKTAFEKFENARDELAARGGGVLYYPAGTYDFSDMPADGPQGRGLMLRSGVIIRGEAPKTDADARRGKLTLPTRFGFGLQKKTVSLGDGKKDVEVPRDWNLIGLQPEKSGRLQDVHTVGIAWVHLVGGVVYFGPDLAWAPSWQEGKSFKSDYAKPSWAKRRPDGTHPYDPFMGAPGLKDGGRYEGAGRQRFVFGCALEKSAFLNDFETCGRKEAPAGYGPAGFHMAKFVARINVYGSRVLIANNYLPMCKDGNFLYDQTTVQTIAQRGNNYAIGKPRTTTVLWDYGRVASIDCNKDKLSLVREALQQPDQGGYFEEGVAVLDNWVWNHGHKGYNLAGNWLTVRHNRNERVFLKGGDDVYGLGANWKLTFDGFIESNAGGGGMISDNLARAFDLAGANLWVDANSFNNTGSSPGNDGEGILCQLHGGTHLYSWALTGNKNEGTPGGNGKGFMGGWAVHCLGFLALRNETQGFVGTQYGKGWKLADFAVIDNKAERVLPKDQPRADPKGDGTGEPIYESPAGPLQPPSNVRAEPYQGDAEQITWKDETANEIGFRVERQIGDGKWAVIAYRPPQREADPLNPPAWVDFLAPPEQPLRYRVVAINGRDDDSGASAPTPAVTLKKGK